MRSGVIDMEETIMSNFLAFRAGMMPSQSVVTKEHSAFISGAERLGDIDVEALNGATGVDECRKADRSSPVPITYFSPSASAAPAKRDIAAIEAAARKLVEMRMRILSVGGSGPFCCSPEAAHFDGATTVLRR